MTLSSKPTKEDMHNDDRKENFPTNNIPSLSNYPSGPLTCRYTTNFEEIHNENPFP